MTKYTLLPALWHSLENTRWALHRTLHSTNTAEPSGTCNGTAKFTSRPPSTFVDRDKQVQPAAGEMLYVEEGSFRMSNSLPNSPAFSFSRKYIWRLRDERPGPPEISIWFTKPGTEEIDYLFHTFLVQRMDEAEGDSVDSSGIKVICSGGHLCVEDFYSSTYVFSGTKTEDGEGMKIEVDSWTMHHDVRGPKKDQSIETVFRKNDGILS